MSLVQKTAKNISYLLVARLSFRFLTAIALIYAARYLGTEQYGMYTTAAAWANAFIALNDLGMSTLMLRVAARKPEHIAAYFGNTLLVEAIASLVIWVALLSIGFSLYDGTTVLLIALLGASNLLYEFRKVMRGVFRANMNLRPIALVELFNGATFFVATMLIIFSVDNTHTGLLGIAHASLWTDVASIIILLAITLRIILPKIDLSSLWQMIREGLPFTVYNWFYMIYFQVNQIILSILLGSVAVALYAAPAQLVTVLLFIPIMVFQVTTPIMYRFSHDDMQQYKRANRILWRHLTAFGVPAGVGMWFLASEILHWLYGGKFFTHSENFTDAVTVMQIFGWFLAVRFFGIAHGNSLTTTDRQGLRAKLQTVSVAANIIIAVVLIRWFGVAGAALATLVTEIFIAFSSLYLSLRYLQEPIIKSVIHLAPVAAAAAAMVGVLSLIKAELHVIVVVFCGALVYGIFLWAFRFFQPDDRELLQKILKRKQPADV